MSSETETIAAIATAPGRGGVGVIRISGPDVPAIAHQCLRALPSPRQAILKTFYDNQTPIDKGLALYFPAPHSFTGEAVLELHGHGGPVVMDLLLSAVLAAGARMAHPGEFSQRAFLNGKIDLTQAEAVADLIEASTKEAVHSANRSLQGVFSQKIKESADAVMHLRLMVEAAIDFSEEDIDWMADQKIVDNMAAISEKLHTLLTQAKQGTLLKDGITLAIVGRPNVGKSSLFNALTQNESAIVTPLPGTTRDLIKESIHIDGYPVHLVDTAGFREKAEPIEQEGIKRAQAQFTLVDRILWIVESPSEEIFPELIPFESKVTQVVNKIDLSGIAPHQDGKVLYVSAKEKQGIDLLRAHIKACMGCQGEESGGFIARKRHLIALQQSQTHLSQAKENLVVYKTFDCAAEELRLAQNCLGEIVGKVTTDNLLGEIFSRFCIGK